MYTFKKVKKFNLGNFEGIIDNGLVEYYSFSDDSIKIPLSHFSWVFEDKSILLKILSDLGYNKEYNIEIISKEREEREETDGWSTTYLRDQFLKFTPIKID